MIGNNKSRNGRRRRVYVDSDLQGRLVVALVALEVTLLVSAVLYLHHAFGDIIDESLYVIHAADRQPLLPRLAGQLGLLMLVCALINTTALFLAHGVWARHVRKVLDDMRKRLDKVRALDLRPDPAWATERSRHRLVELTERWIESERHRMVAVRIAAARLPSPLPCDPHSREAAEVLDALREAAQELRHGGRDERGQRKS